MSNHDERIWVEYDERGIAEQFHFGGPPDDDEEEHGPVEEYVRTDLHRGGAVEALRWIAEPVVAL